VDEIAGYPFEPHRVEFDGLAMSYVDEGEGAPVLLLHGEPTWSFLWRNVIPQLPGRVVAPDLIGFGLSDKPEDVAWYSYDRHVRSIAHLVETLDLREVTLVVHDWGGPIGLRVAVEHEARVARLVVLNTAIGGGRAPSETWLRFRQMVRDAGDALDVGRLVAAGTAQGLSDEDRAAYDG
jgi:haloalkane dehalogenase